MKLAEDSGTAEWLQQLSGGQQDFDWDAGNRTKSRKHGVETTDVEGMFQRPTVFLGRIIEPAHDEDRWLLLGQDLRGRRLTLVFARRGDQVRPVSCRPMRRTEKKIYEEAGQPEA